MSLVLRQSWFRPQRSTNYTEKLHAFASDLTKYLGRWYQVKMLQIMKSWLAALSRLGLLCNLKIHWKEMRKIEEKYQRITVLYKYKSIRNMTKR